MVHFGKKLKGFHDLTSARLLKEEEELSNNTASGGRKSLIFSIENAKKESLSPTKMAETLDDALEGLLVTLAYIKLNKITLHIYIYIFITSFSFQQFITILTTTHYTYKNSFHCSKGKRAR